MTGPHARRLLSLLTACLSAFLFGWHSGVINPPREAMTSCESTKDDCVPMDSAQWGVFVALFLVGGVVGGLYGGNLSDLLGRKRSLAYNNALFLTGAVLLTVGRAPFVFYFARLVIGIAAGCGTVQLPLYISDISPPELRQMYGSLNQLFIVVGVLVSNICGAILSTPTQWRTLFALSALPSIIQLIIFPTCVESPLWLAKALGSTAAQEARAKLDLTVVETQSVRTAVRRNSTRDLENHAETDTFLDEDARKMEAQPLTLSAILADPTIKRQLMIGLIMHTAQQFSGINAAVYYSSTIFRRNFDSTTSNYLTVLVSVAQLVFTLITTATIELIGTKKLLMASELGMCLFSLIIGISGMLNFPIILVIALMGFVASFSLGLGPIPWTLLTELVPEPAKSTSQSLGTAVNWGCAFLIALIFPIADAALGFTVFYIFSAFLAFYYIFTSVMLDNDVGHNVHD